MKIRMLNGANLPAPYDLVLRAHGHEVAAISPDGKPSSASDNPDILIWNFSHGQSKSAADYDRFSAETQRLLLPTLAVIPKDCDDLEEAAHGSGVEYVLRQPASAHDLLMALTRTNFEFRSTITPTKPLPTLLFAGADDSIARWADDHELRLGAVCIIAEDFETAKNYCDQMIFDCILICEEAGSLAYHQTMAGLKPLCGTAPFLSFVEYPEDARHESGSSDLTLLRPELTSGRLLFVVNELLDDQIRAAERKKLDVEIISKQQELQRVNAMLRTINKAFRDTNLRLEREGHTKDQMIGVAAHELKSPLAAMAGAIDVLCEDLEKFDSHEVRMLELIRRNNFRMIKLVENVLDLSRVESRRLTLKPVVCNPISLIEQAVETVSVRAKSKQVRFDVLDIDELPEWKADVLKVLQMLVNLLDNAVKFSPTQGIIRVIVRSVGQEIHFVVSDDGPGIPLADRAVVFERFHHRPKGDDPLTAGSGLGLTITKALAEFMGGRVTVGESPSGGALVTISLPLG